MFACVLGGGLLGTFLRGRLPERHLSAESKDLVRLAMGLLATMSALVVGLLITTAKTAYDTQGGEFRRMSAEIVLLDRAPGPLRARGERQRASISAARVTDDAAVAWSPQPDWRRRPPDPTGRTEGFFDADPGARRRRPTPSARCGPRRSGWRSTSASFAG